MSKRDRYLLGGVMVMIGLAIAAGHLSKNPCESASEQLHDLQLQREQYVKEGNMKMHIATNKDLQQAETAVGKACAR